jgi:hypothetical protein
MPFGQVMTAPLQLVKSQKDAPEQFSRHWEFCVHSAVQFELPLQLMLQVEP